MNEKKVASDEWERTKIRSRSEAIGSWLSRKRKQRVADDQ